MSERRALRSRTPLCGREPAAGVEAILVNETLAALDLLTSEPQRCRVALVERTRTPTSASSPPRSMSSGISCTRASTTGSALAGRSTAGRSTDRRSVLENSRGDHRPRMLLASIALRNPSSCCPPQATPLFDAARDDASATSILLTAAHQGSLARV